MINESKLFFQTYSGFERELSNGNIKQDSIVFIKDIRSIWTHGVLFDGGSHEDPTPSDPDPQPATESYKHIFLTQAEYNALQEYEQDAIYFILGSYSPVPTPPEEEPT